MTTLNNAMTHATHDVVTEARRLRSEQPDFNSEQARKLANDYQQNEPEVARFFKDMATWLDENPPRPPYQVLAIATSMQGRHLRGGNPVEDLVERREITDDIPADVIGECVATVVQRAWRAGYDPTTIMFKVRFE